MIWDGRFKIKMQKINEKHLKLSRLSRKGFDQISNAGYYNFNSDIPEAAYLSLPALWDKGKVVVVPHLDINLYKNIEISIHFSPPQPLVPPNFVVVK